MAAKKPAAKVDPRDQEILRLVAENRKLADEAKKAFVKIERLDGELNMARRERNTVHLNCTNYRIRLEQAETALKVLSAVVADQRAVQIDRRARRAVSDEAELIPF